MHNRYWVGIYRTLFALFACAALGTQLYQQLTKQAGVLNFFSFFTIESNIIAAAVFLTGGVCLMRRKKPTPFSTGFELLRGAAALYMVTTGIVYALLLSGLDATLDTTIPWVNAAVHYIMPVAVLADWLVVPPDQPIPFKRGLLWLVFPLAYITYSLVRGAFVQWYPYPFLNALSHGYVRVAVMSAGIAAAMVGLVAFFTWITRFKPVKTR